MTYHSSVIILNHLSEMLGGSVHVCSYNRQTVFNYSILLFNYNNMLIRLAKFHVISVYIVIDLITILCIEIAYII